MVDVGNVIEVYAESTRSGATYVPFPDSRSHRIRLAELADAAVRARLATIWRDPLALDPAATPAQQARIGDLAEQIDAHRKRVLAAHEELTLTGLYNVMQKVSAGGTVPLTVKEKAIHEKGLVAVLASLHAELDAAVLAAYGWNDLPVAGWNADAADAMLLERLVALNAERTAEEAQGHVRWLRPEFQNPGATQAALPVATGPAAEAAAPAAAPPQTVAWPATLPEQMAALAAALAAAPCSEAQLAARFAGKGRWKSRLPELLATLATLGRARRLDDGRWMG